MHLKEAQEKIIDICGGYKVCWLALQLSTAAHTYPEELRGGCRRPIFKQNQKSPQRHGWVNACTRGCVARSSSGSGSTRNVWLHLSAPQPKSCLFSDLEDSIYFFKET